MVRHRLPLPCSGILLRWLSDKGTASILVSFHVGLIGLQMLSLTSYASPWRLFARYLFSCGMFGFLIGCANWLAVRVLFRRMPLLLGSGYVKNRIMSTVSKQSVLCISQFQPCPPPPPPSPPSSPPGQKKCPNCHGGAKNLEKMPHPRGRLGDCVMNFMQFLHALREALLHFRSWCGNVVTSVNTNSSSVDRSETGDSVRQVRALYVSAEVAAVTLPCSLSESRYYNLVVPLRCGQQ